MAQNTDEIQRLLATISNNSTSLDMLLELEKTLDDANVYAYKNWMNGELIKGPEISKYWVDTWWMFPENMMPDPDGGMRLLKYGCKIKYGRDILNTPVRITGPEAYNDEMTKTAKMKKQKVWIVKITIPRKFVDEGMDDTYDIDDGNVDTSDIEDAYNENLNSGKEGGDELESTDTESEE